MRALVGAFNQEKALVGAFSVIVQPVVEPMDRFTALIRTREDKLRDLGPQLSKILDTTLPVQKYLELPLTDTRDQLGTNYKHSKAVRSKSPF